MSSSNDDIQDSSSFRRSTPSQSNQQKDKEARRDAEDRLRNFNYAKSIGAEGKDEEGDVKPLSSLAQRYLSNLKGRGDDEQNDDVGEDNTATSSPTSNNKVIMDKEVMEKKFQIILQDKKISSPMRMHAQRW